MKTTQPLKTILVVDDEPDLLAAVSGVLADEGYGVIECCDHRQALERLESHKPDAVLLDVMMPEVSGVELAQKMRQDPRFEKLPIVIMSAVEGTDIDQRAFAGFLRKPFKVQRLLQIIEKIAA